MICNNCGLPFDESDLSMVGYHEHNGLDLPKIKGKILINHARDIFPNASIQFCMGVHNYLSDKYDMSHFYKETQDFKSGYYQAMDLNLIETHTLTK